MISPARQPSATRSANHNFWLCFSFVLCLPQATEKTKASLDLLWLSTDTTVSAQCYRTIPESRAANAACCSSCGSVFYCTAACMATSAALHSGADECSTLRRLRGNFEQSRDVRLLYAATTSIDCCWS